MATIIPFHVPVGFHRTASARRSTGRATVIAFHPAVHRSKLADWRILGLTVPAPLPRSQPHRYTS